ncbi:hypothetical protein C8J56DRAFT_880862 [Mycena floridula]|nr:hypothetical protein C8J56DRAFT_880862 [Mycena floridula]
MSSFGPSKIDTEEEIAAKFATAAFDAETMGGILLGPNGLPKIRTEEEIAVNKRSTFCYGGRCYFHCGDQGTLSAQYYAFKEFTVQIIQTAMCMQGIPSVHQDIIKAELIDHSQHQGASFAMTEETDEDYHRCLQQSVDHCQLSFPQRIVRFYENHKVQTSLEADNPARIKREIADARADMAQFLVAETDRMTAYNKQLLLQLEKDQRERRAGRVQRLCSPCGLMQNIRDLHINDNSEQLETDNWWPKMLPFNDGMASTLSLSDQSIPISDPMFEATLLGIESIIIGHQPATPLVLEGERCKICLLCKQTSKATGLLAKHNPDSVPWRSLAHSTLSTFYPNFLPKDAFHRRPLLRPAPLPKDQPLRCLVGSFDFEKELDGHELLNQHVLRCLQHAFRGFGTFHNSRLWITVHLSLLLLRSIHLHEQQPTMSLASQSLKHSPTQQANLVLENIQSLHAKLRWTVDDDAVDTLVDTIVKLLGRMSSLDTRIDDAIGAMNLTQSGLSKYKLPHFDWDAEMAIVNQLYAGPNALHLGINAQVQGTEADIEARVQAAEDAAIKNSEPFNREKSKVDFFHGRVSARLTSDFPGRHYRLDGCRARGFHSKDRRIYMALVKLKKEDTKAEVLMMAEHILNRCDLCIKGIPPFPTATTDRDGVENFWFALKLQAQLPGLRLYPAPGLPGLNHLSALYNPSLSPVIIYDYGAGFQGPSSVLISTPYDSDDSDDLPALVSDESASLNPSVGEQHQGQPQVAFKARPVVRRKRSN